MAAEEVVHITIANRKDLTIMRVNYNEGYFKRKNITIYGNFRLPFQRFLARELTLMLTKME